MRNDLFSIRKIFVGD